MMKPFGYDVHVYASDLDDSGATLHTCITKSLQDYFLSHYDWYEGKSYYKIPFDPSLPIWRFFIQNVIKELRCSYSQDDLILISSPIFYAPIHRVFPLAKIIEYGVGYPTILSPYRVFESHSWRNFCYGSNHVSDLSYMNDDVIPNYYDPQAFPLVKEKQDYLVFMGRPIPSKGIAWVQILSSMGHKIKVAGSQELRGENIQWVGYVEGKQKADLLGNAKALLSPTMYLEPFGGVVAEAGLCGTPSITTNWGCYQETIEHGKTGFRINTFTEMKDAVALLDSCDPSYISSRSASLWSTSVIGQKYHKYFTSIR